MDFFAEWINKGYTSIFEWVSPEYPIVLQYNQASLTLIAIRHNITGNTISTLLSSLLFYALLFNQSDSNRRVRLL